ncbi:cell envelope integrity protein TolA, partial [Vibrio alginolyticus]|nr:cell envelope integrity protein TolA [Vibrio alginolyticus]
KYRKIAEKYELDNELQLTGKNVLEAEVNDKKLEKSIKRQFRAINEHIKKKGKLKGLSQAEINKELKKNDARMNKKLNSDGLLEGALWTAYNNANNMDEFLQILDDMKADGIHINIRATLRKKDDINSGVKGLSYALSDENGNVLTCMAASKINKAFSPKNFFESYPEMEDYLLGKEPKKDISIKPSNDFKRPKPKDILPMVFWLNKHNNKIAHYYDNTKPKPQSLMCKQDTETGTITILDQSKEGAFKIMQLSKDWNGILITTNSSKDASYRLEAWLKLDTEPKKSIASFNFDKSSRVKEMKWSDFREAVDGMKFSQEEISHIKKNILSPQDAEKYSDELDNMLKVNKNDVKNIVDNILDGAEEERKAKLEAEQKAKAEREAQEAKAKLELEQKAKQEAAERAKREALAKQETERKAKAEQEAREKAELEAKAKQEAEKQEQEQISNDVAEKPKLKTYKRGLFEFGGKKIEEVKELIDEGYN